MEKLPKERQGLFFSATIPPDIERMAQAQLKDPEFVTLSSDQVGALEINHFVYIMRSGDKRQELIRILEVEDPESAVVFCNTKEETERMAEALQNKGYDADWLNGDLEQKERERKMAATREGKVRFLVATDVAARGIDISHLTHVINADFPETAEQYVHRTGRTGRAGRTGTAISIVGPKDIGSLYILRLTYKIRPIERQIPTVGELQTRQEHDIVAFFADAFASRPVDPNDLALARRLLTHADAEKIVAGLIRDHLGASAGGGDPTAQAAEARRARNPAPMHASVPEVPEAESARGESDAVRPRPRERERDREPRARDDRGGRGRDAGRRGGRDTASVAASPRAERPEARTPEARTPEARTPEARTPEARTEEGRAPARPEARAERTEDSRGAPRRAGACRTRPTQPGSLRSRRMTTSRSLRQASRRPLRRALRGARRGAPAAYPVERPAPPPLPGITESLAPTERAPSRDAPKAGTRTRSASRRFS